METESRFNPGWEFMENPSLNQIQRSLDESLSAHDDIQQSRDSYDIFSVQFASYFVELMQHRPDRMELEQLIAFTRTNFRHFDAGGFNAGRSEQYNLLSFANDKLIEILGEDEYFSIVEKIDAG